MVAGRPKTPASQSSVLTGISVFSPRGNPAHPPGNFGPFSVLVPGAMGHAGPKYREWAFGLGAGMNRRVTGI